MFESFNMGRTDLNERHYKSSAVIIKAKFISWEIRLLDGNRYVIYKIKIFNVLFCYYIERRFSDFKNFREDLVSDYSHIKWPELP